MSRVAKQMIQPVSALFDMLKRHDRIQIWLTERPSVRIEGILFGFDEFMNLTLHDAEEIDTKTGARVSLGRTLLKGDNITLIMKAEAAAVAGAADAGSAAAAGGEAASSSSAAAAAAAPAEA
ncbi:hypothetical protein FNF27_01466 [Cafeteria roenbergensis]|uniref:Small nuclear ribonucleoprotein E n=1 Tax=Cafeteria roenbergensis TaxID=33653 RepID=A0A5A8EGY0_CAFRO|nr:hypothetical protein FNF27_01466 [Cafeteria roenbergensis]